MTEKSQDNVFAPLATLENDIDVFINDGKYSLRTVFEVSAALVPPVLGWFVSGLVGGLLGIGISCSVAWVVVEKRRCDAQDAQIAAENMEAEEGFLRVNGP